MTDGVIPAGKFINGPVSCSTALGRVHLKNMAIYSPTGDQFILCTTKSGDPKAAFTNCISSVSTSSATTCYSQSQYSDADIDMGVNEVYVQIACANSAASCTLKTSIGNGNCDNTALYATIGGSIGGFIVLACLCRCCCCRRKTRYLQATQQPVGPATTQTIVMMQQQQQQQPQQPQMQMVPFNGAPGMQIVPGSYSPNTVYQQQPLQQQQPVFYSPQQPVVISPTHVHQQSLSKQI